MSSILGITPSIVSAWQETERAPVICNYNCSASALVGFRVTSEPAMLPTALRVFRRQRDLGGGESSLSLMLRQFVLLIPEFIPQRRYARARKKKRPRWRHRRFCFCTAWRARRGGSAGCGPVGMGLGMPKGLSCRMISLVWTSSAVDCECRVNLKAEQWPSWCPASVNSYYRTHWSNFFFWVSCQ